ncbi:MAG: beta-ketoacyl-[acyl-carrier-protein] synthase family protein, partial [Planctomycetota bacterium]
VTAPHPEGKGLERAITRALEVAGRELGDVRLVNAHGTSTRDNDQVEGRVLGRMLGRKIPVVATKAYTGHTLGAAGALEAIFTLKALQDGVAPATAGFEELDPDCGIAPTREVTSLEGGIALSNSLAFGGNNSVLVLARA